MAEVAETLVVQFFEHEADEYRKWKYTHYGTNGKGAIKKRIKELIQEDLKKIDSLQTEVNSNGL